MTHDEPKDAPERIWAKQYDNGIVGARDRAEPYSPLSSKSDFYEYIRTDLAAAETAAAVQKERERICELIERRITGNGIKSGRDLECEEIAAAIREGGE